VGCLVNLLKFRQEDLDFLGRQDAKPGVDGLGDVELTDRAFHGHDLALEGVLPDAAEGPHDVLVGSVG